jgi:TIR domain
VTKIIISYRRADSDVFAGRVRDSVANNFGEESVFIDVDNIPFGKDFRVHIQEAMAAADAVLIVIGPAWLGLGNDGHSRIMDDRDPVRIEVETALKHRIATIPVLVGKTTMPAPEQLPDSIRELAFLNAASVDTGRDFHRDLDRIIEAIGALLCKAGKRQSLPSPKRRPWLRPSILASAVAAFAIVVGLAIAGHFYLQPIVTRGAAFGGVGGDPFDDTKSKLYNHRPISGFNIIVSLSPYDHTQQIIGSVQLLWDDTPGPLDGKAATLPQPVQQVRFQENQKIVRVDVHWGTYHWPANTPEPAPQWVAGLSIWTNIGNYDYGDTSFGSTGQCVLQYGDTLLGFYGRAGSYIDQLGCVIGTTK